MNDRIKLKTAAPKTREEMEVMVGNITALKIEERQLKAEMDAELKSIKDDYLERLNALNESIAGQMPRALAWAEAHPEDFGKMRSIDMLHGVIGWRLNTPSLKTFSGWTWDLVLKAVQKVPRFATYVRTKEELNKQALLADREAIGADGLRAIGVRVIQEEEFFVEPKLTETDSRETAS